MKAKHGLFFGIAVLLAAAIFSLAGCPKDSPEPETIASELQGTWKEKDGGKITLEFTKTSFTWSGDEYFKASNFDSAIAQGAEWQAGDGKIDLDYKGSKVVSFTYTISGSELTITYSGATWGVFVK